MQNKKVVVSVVVLAIIIFIIMAFSRIKSSVLPTTLTDTPSITGCYIATLSKDIYTLTILSQNGDQVIGNLSYKNFDKDSSSGSFTGKLNNNILIGDYEFDSEGMHSIRQVIFKKSGDRFIEGFGPTQMIGKRETLINIGDVAYDPKLTFIKMAMCNDNIKHYVDPAGIFSFYYNQDFIVANGKQSLTNSWRSNTTTTGKLLATVTVPKSYMIGTNFSEAKLTVGRSNDSSSITTCTAQDTGDNGNITSATINGAPFKKFSSSDAGAGNFYETTSYRAILDGYCYAIEYTIHSTNIGNYSPEQGIKEFDKSKVVHDLEAIVESFVFLINSH